MTLLAAALGRQLARPTGVGGRIIGQAMRVANRRPTRLAIEALDGQPGDSVLDLGCGTGDAIPGLMAAAGSGRVHGLDHSRDMIATAARLHPEATFHCAPFTAIPLRDGSIDRVLAANVAYFWQDDRAVLAEIARILRPGGRLALYVTTADALRRIGLGDSGTHRLFTCAGLRAMLGPRARITSVNAGFGVSGIVAILDAPIEARKQTR